MSANLRRLSGWAPIIGTVVATVGYVAAYAMTTQFTGSLWMPLYSIALAGDIIIVLGLPAIPPDHAAAPASRAARGAHVERDTGFALGHLPELRDGPVHADPAQDRLADRSAVVDEQRAVKVAALRRRVGGGA